MFLITPISLETVILTGTKVFFTKSTCYRNLRQRWNNSITKITKVCGITLMIRKVDSEKKTNRLHE
jgi:hypothetical protein